MFTELNISPVKRACDHKRGGLPDGRLCGSYHERASLRSNEYCRRKAIHLTAFARPCPSAKCLKILLCRNGGSGGSDATRSYATKYSHRCPSSLPFSLLPSHTYP